jgi:hypothetical protein
LARSCGRDGKGLFAQQQERRDRGHPMMLRTMKSRCLPPLLAALTSFWAHAQQIDPDWVRVNPGRFGEMLALDRDNNAYVAGSVPWSAMLIAKYSATGTPLWQRTYDNPGTREQSSWISVDAAGNAIVIGHIIGGDAGAANGLIVLKYNPAGTLLWQDVVTSAFGYAARASTDAAGNVYVIGRAWVANPLGKSGADIGRLVGIKYAPDGTRLWTREFGLDGVSADAPASMLVTAAGHLIVVGGSNGSMALRGFDAAGNLISSKSVAASPGDVALGPAGEFYVVGGPNTDPRVRGFLVIKHDSNFNELWRKTYAVGHWGWRVAVDSQGNAVVTGVTGNASLDWMTIKLDPNGALLWSRRFNAHKTSDAIPFSMAIGYDDAVYITGQAGPEPTAPTAGKPGELSTLTVKYAADGTQVWAAATPEADRGLGVKLGSDNSVFVVSESPLAVFRYPQTAR